MLWRFPLHAERTPLQLTPCHISEDDCGQKVLKYIGKLLPENLAKIDGKDFRSISLTVHLPSLFFSPVETEEQVVGQLKRRLQSLVDEALEDGTALGKVSVSPVKPVAGAHNLKEYLQQAARNAAPNMDYLGKKMECTALRYCGGQNLNNIGSRYNCHPARISKWINECSLILGFPDTPSGRPKKPCAKPPSI